MEEDDTMMEEVPQDEDQRVVQVQAAATLTCRDHAQMSKSSRSSCSLPWVPEKRITS